MSEFNNGIFSNENNNDNINNINNSENMAQGANEKSFEPSYNSDSQNSQQYSTCYQPPYYVPNFSTETPAVKPKKKKGIGKVAIAAIITGGILMLAILALGGYALNMLMGTARFNSNTDLSDENLSIMQNAPQMEINQNADDDYVPKSLPEVVNKVGNSVVEISTSSIKKDYFYGQYVTSGAGSGVIVTQSSKAGYLLTNYHVIYETNGKLVDTITVVLTNGESYEATLIGSDESLDLALIRIEKKDDEEFTVASFGKSSNLVVGQDVVAIGNPLGSLGGTVTDGIISALDRRVEIDGVEMVLLQHNAAINPGNSGGALFDMMGNLVGIVNAKTSDTGIEGLGFAIPSDIAFNFINRIMVVEPAIGIKVQYGTLNRVLGLYVVETVNAEFEKYDRIVKINGENIESAAQYYAVVDSLKIGDTATITVRRNGADLDIKVTLK